MIENQIKELTNKRIVEIMEMDAESKKFKENVFDVKIKQAKLGLIHQRETELAKRINQSQVIRVIQFISSDNEERRQYIKAAMPAMLPDKTKN